MSSIKGITQAIKVLDIIVERRNLELVLAQQVLSELEEERRELIYQKESLIQRAQNATSKAKSM